MSTISPYVFDRFFGNSSFGWVNQNPVFADEICQQDDGSYRMDIAVPGFSKENIDIVAKDGYLNITLKQENKKDKNLTYKLTSKIDTTKITANCKNGILTILCPILETAKPISIKID